MHAIVALQILSSLPPHENSNWVNLLEWLCLLESGETLLFFTSCQTKQLLMRLLTDYLTDYVLKPVLSSLVPRPSVHLEGLTKTICIALQFV